MNRLLRRFVASALLVWAVFTLTFFLSRWAPGSPFQGERKLPPEIMRSILAYYHLDRPLSIQYWEALKKTASGDWGSSFKNPGIRVSDVIGQALPVSVTLGGVAFLEAIFFALVLGTWMALSKGPVKGVLRSFSALGVALPSFLLAALLIDFFSIRLSMFPPALWNGWGSIILPSLAMAIAPAGYLARLFATSLEEAIRAPHYQAARGRGIRRIRLIVTHGWLLSLNAIVSIIGPISASFLTGSFVVESLFAIPGIGRVFVLSVTNRDYPLIMGTTLVYTIFLVGMTLVGDVIGEWIDPRVRAL
jgi:oligopeptide transport system permease protein|uniref:ABC transporter permease n=1 Tax=Leptospirillum ferriphilum TaxID=178606 RepID=A0A7C3LS70_9BACT